MATRTSPRVSSFSGLHLYQQYEPSALLAQKIQKLRVNRIALVQILKVDHVLPRLLTKGVISESERKSIVSGRTVHDKTRILLDIIADKGNTVDWFGEFKDALRNPDTSNPDIKKKYMILVDFLDNTLIQVPPRQSPPPRKPVTPIAEAVENRNYPRYKKLPNISSTSQSPVKSPVKSTKDYHQHVYDEDDDSMVSGSISYATINQYSLDDLPELESYQPLIQKPVELYAALSKSGTPEDKKLLTAEKYIFKQALEVEMIYALEKRHQVPEDFTLCFSVPIQTMLKDSTNNHLYFKYLYGLKSTYSMDILAEVAHSLIEIVDKQKDCGYVSLRQIVIDTGFSLFDYLSDCGMYHKAERLILTVMRYLSTQPTLENWLSIWEGLVRMFNISNTNIRFTDANMAYNQALQIGHKVKLMSFGHDLMDESKLFTELSVTMREQGSLQPAFSWAQRAIKEVDEVNTKGVVECLCNAVLIYCMKWKVKLAENLAVVAVQYAREHFDTHHPVYVKALLHYVYYSNEFRQDAMGIQVATRALECAQKIYGDAPSIVLAQAHEALAKALMAGMQFQTDAFVQHAMSAWKIAQDVLPGDHPKLALFRYTNAQVLQWKAVNVEADKTEGYLVWAETEAKAAVSIFRSHWGEYSLKTVQAYMLLGQIYAKMNKPEKAEEFLVGAQYMLKLCLAPNSNYHSLCKGTTGLFYRSIDKPLEAIASLKECLNGVESCGIYLKWVQMCYDSVISLCKAVGQSKDAEHYQIGLIDWLKSNPKFGDVVSWDQLHGDPPTLAQIKASVFKMQAQLGKVKDGLNKLANHESVGTKLFHGGGDATLAESHSQVPHQVARSEEPLTASMLAAFPPQEQKQMLGERLYPVIQAMYPELAGKITGMLLEMDNSEILEILQSQGSLKAKVEEAVTVLQARYGK